MIIDVPVSWLREYVDIPWPLEELTHRLTMLGLEVEHVARQGASAEGVVIGHVLLAEKHPNADRLSLCTVHTGDEMLEIVCGAPNVATGQRVAVARVGTVLPGGMEIRQAKIRGVVSNGMICSEAELGLSDEADGIMVLASDAPVGRPLSDLIGDPEVILSINVGTNRPDCLSLVGIAREVAALTRGALRLPDATLQETGPPVSEEASVAVFAPDDCPRFVGRVVKNVHIGPSPDWMVRRLKAAGIRPINNVVDVTNYVMLELGQPLHAYDLDRLAGRSLIVRRASETETFVTLDGQERGLSAEVLMIADRERYVGAAGVMGGLNTEITPETTHVFLEGACWTPDRIRAGARRLNLATDASRRFERGVDPELQDYAVARAARLVAETAGGQIGNGVIDVRVAPTSAPVVRLRPERVHLLLGVAIGSPEICDILEALRFEVKDEDGTLIVTPPSYRRDVTREADLIEEIARLYGYDRIDAIMSTPSPLDMDESMDSARMQYRIQRQVRETTVGRIRDLLTGAGFTEIVSHSFVHPDQNRAVMPHIEGLMLENPLSPELSAMRASLAASVLNVVRWNMNRQVRDMCIFEVARVYRPCPDGPLPDEPVELCIVMTGRRSEPHWSGVADPVNFFDIKGVADFVLDRFALDNILAVPYDGAQGPFDPSSAARLMVGDVCAGFCGRVGEAVRQLYDLREPVWMALINVEYLYGLSSVRRVYRAMPKFPSVERDLAVIVAEKIEHQAIAETLYESCGPLLERLALFDVYRGKQVPAGKKSLAYAMWFRAADRTLTDEEVNTLQHKAVACLKTRYDVELRV
ncbi:MAG: phenylalanine--tRNA ligase subunit beta [candidate division Zixibacteria bacterium]|nr:phenylalanine--tRNA ligase subunit beta [candidate division Zixibacteria bacterium]